MAGFAFDSKQAEDNEKTAETRSDREPATPFSSSGATAPGTREPDAIYQNNSIVARVSGAEVDDEAKELRIDEVYKSDDLLIPEECEFREFRILIQRITFASRVDKTALHKGRVLKGVSADILGFREQ